MPQCKEDAITGWGKLDIAAKAIGTVLIPLAVAYVGSAYSSAISNRQIEAKFVELGISILQAPPSEANGKLRAWAAKVLDKYSIIKFSEEDAGKQLIDNQMPQFGAISNSLQLYCVCDGDKTYCFREESDCQRRSNECLIRYRDNDKYDILNGGKWKQATPGWVSDQCLIAR